MQSAFLKYSHICGGTGQISQCNSVWHYTTESKGVGVVGGESGKVVLERISIIRM